MKIIGRTSDAFLVEITENEIAACCGFTSTHGEGWQQFLREHGRRNSYNDFKMEVGCEFHAKAISDWHYNLQYKHKQVKESAGLLRSLADMIEHAPAAFTVPPTPAEISAACTDADVSES